MWTHTRKEFFFHSQQRNMDKHETEEITMAAQQKHLKTQKHTHTFSLQPSVCASEPSAAALQHTEKISGGGGGFYSERTLEKSSLWPGLRQRAAEVVQGERAQRGWQKAPESLLLCLRTDGVTCRCVSFGDVGSCSFWNLDRASLSVFPSFPSLHAHQTASWPQLFTHRHQAGFDPLIWLSESKWRSRFLCWAVVLQWVDDAPSCSVSADGWGMLIRIWSWIDEWQQTCARHTASSSSSSPSLFSSSLNWTADGVSAWLVAVEI